jgi:LuxR family transcriptional regulator, maltose regulon positive regulatory protein
LALRVQTHTATVMFRAKQVAKALESFSDIVAVFARAGIYQPILDEGKEIGPLLAAFQDNAVRASGSRELKSYISDLDAAWKSRYESERQAPASPAAESLSPRERDILRLIAEGLSNKQIAKDLTIAPETVKSHIKHIFIKLNVEKRAQAVSRAQILGLAGIHR